jgi:hypothetical protein
MDVAVHWHDMWNIVALGCVNLVCGAAVCGVASHTLYARTLWLYVVADALYVARRPLSVPMVSAVLVHHVSVLGLLCVPLWNPQHAPCATLMGAVEADTWLMTLRRSASLRPALKQCIARLNHGTFIVTRCVLHPLVLVMVWTGDFAHRVWITAAIGVIMAFSIYLGTRRRGTLRVIARTARLCTGTGTCSESLSCAIRSTTPRPGCCPLDTDKLW